LSSTIQISGNDFIKKIIDGEKDFKKVSLPKGYSLEEHEGYSEAVEYMKGAGTETEPYDFSEAKFDGVIASGIHIPHMKAQKSIFTGCGFKESVFERVDLTDAVCTRSNFAKTVMKEGQFVRAKLDMVNFEIADIEGGNFWLADLSCTIFIKARLFDAIFCEARLVETDFQHANIKNANFWKSIWEKANFLGAHFKNANIKDIVSLEKAKHLEYAIYQKTRVQENIKKYLLEKMEMRFFHSES
jgi:uncharacterized protein YjbI with pentapeptide repeats